MATDCSKLTGLPQYICELEGQREARGFTEQEEKLYACVKDKYVKSGGTEEQLKKILDVGYYSDMNASRKFNNIEGKVESLELLDFAYADPNYYECLNSAGYEAAFAMNDFDPNTEMDAEMKARVEMEVDAIKEDLISKKGLKEGTDEYVYAFAKAIYEGTSALNFKGDCQVECRDYESLKYKRGACSETTTINYYKAKYAGLDPQLFFMRNFEPSLEWIPLMERIGATSDHVLLGIPVPSKYKNDPTNTNNFIHLDVAMKKFDAKYKYVVPISEREFMSGHLLNEFLELDDKGKKTEAVETFRSLLALDDKNFLFLFVGDELMDKRSDENSAFMRQYWGKNFPNSLFGKITSIERESMSMNELFELAKSDRENGSKLLHYAALKSSAALVKQFGKPTDFSKVSDEYKAMSAQVMMLYQMAFELNPNDMLQFRDMMVYARTILGPQFASQGLIPLVRKFSAHPPLLHELAKLSLEAIDGMGGNKEMASQSMQNAATAIKTLMQIDPNNPAVLALMGNLTVYLGNTVKGLELIVQSISMYEKEEDVPASSYGLAIPLAIGIRESGLAFDLAKKATSIDGAGSRAKVIAEEMLKQLYSIFDPPKSDVIEDGACNEEVEDKMYYFYEGLSKVSSLLYRYPEARKSLATLMTKMLPFSAFIGGKQIWSPMVEAMKEEGINTEVQLFADSLDKTGETLLSSPCSFNANGLKNMAEYVDEISPLMDEKFLKQKSVMYSGFLWQYVLLQDEGRAGEFLDKLEEKMAGPLAEVFSSKLEKFGGGSKVNLMRRYFILDLLWDRRDNLKEDVKRSAAEGYFLIIKDLRANGFEEQALEAEDRAEELSK